MYRKELLISVYCRPLAGSPGTCVASDSPELPGQWVVHIHSSSWKKPPARVVAEADSKDIWRSLRVIVSLQGTSLVSATVAQLQLIVGIVAEPETSNTWTMPQWAGNKHLLPKNHAVALSMQYFPSPQTITPTRVPQLRTTKPTYPVA